jgi:MFS transporter, PPP family, 3-phenylpropionic acid transporter
VSQSPQPARPVGNLRLLFLANGVFCAAVWPFSAVILRDRGLDPATIGLVLGAGALGATVITPWFGHLGDVVVGRVTAVRLTVGMAVITATALFAPLPIAIVAVAIASVAVQMNLVMGLADALAVAALRAPTRQYGGLRSLTSLSYASAVITAGFVYNSAGYEAAPVGLLIAGLAIFLVVGHVPDQTRDRRGDAAVSGQGDGVGGRFGSISRALVVEPRLLVLLAALALAYTGVMAGITFVSIRIDELGGRPSDVALSWGISAVSEIPGLIATGFLVRRFGLRAMFLAALAMHAILIGSWGVLPTPDAINATRLFTGLCFGSLLATRVLAIDRLLPAELQGTGQTLMTAVTFGLGAVAGSVVGGVVYGIGGPAVFFAFASGLTIAGGIGTWVALRPAEPITTIGPIPDDRVGAVIRSLAGRGPTSDGIRPLVREAEEASDARRQGLR